jgi:hypothetical protein
LVAPKVAKMVVSLVATKVELKAGRMVEQRVVHWDEKRVGMKVFEWVVLRAGKKAVCSVEKSVGDLVGKMVDLMVV